MEFLQFLFGSSVRTRATPPPDDDDFWYSPVTAGGAVLSENLAYNLPSVYACVRLLAESVSTLPLILYERLIEGGKKRAPDHPLARILKRIPNRWQTKTVFWETMMGHLALRGNAYAEIVRKVNNEIFELLPLHPDRMKVWVNSDKTPYYEYTRDNGESVKLSRDRVMHIYGLSTDGYCGISPLMAQQRLFAQAQAQDKFSNAFFDNMAMPGGVLKHPNKLGEKAAENLRKSWEKLHKGGSNAYRVAVLEEGVTWESVNITQRDAEFLATKKMTRSEIASIFRVPPHMIGDLDRATFSNIEQQSIEFVTNTLRPWLVRIEECIVRDLLVEEDQDQFFAEFLVDGLLRGDLASRYSAYSIGLNNGFLNIDEVRSFENLNPVPDGLGQSFRIPLNTAPVDSPAASALQQENDPVDSGDEEAHEMERFERLNNFFERVFVDTYSRLVRKEATKLRSSKLLPESKELNAWYDQHATEALRALDLVLRAYFEHLADNLEVKLRYDFDLDCLILGALKADRAFTAQNIKLVQTEFERFSTLKAEATWDSVSNIIIKYVIGLKDGN